MNTPETHERLLIVCGENSGDLHGAALVREIRKLRPTLPIDAVGGDRMQAAGATLVDHIRHLSCAGIVEVIKALPRVRRVFQTIMRHVESNTPSVVVLIDFPDFNMRLAARLKRMGIPLVWFISPQVWAWRRGRIKTLAALLDRMLVIFPFEKDLYHEAGLPSEFVGHPLVDKIQPDKNHRQTLRNKMGYQDTDYVVGLLPGSRRSEYQRLFPVMQDALRLLLQNDNTIKGIASIADTLDETWCRSFDDQNVSKTWQVGQAEDIMEMADFCFVASGTATLQTCLYETPMAVVYKVHPMTYWMLRPLVQVKHMSIVNLLAEDEIVPEFLQQQASGQNLANAARHYRTPEHRETMLQNLRQVKSSLGTPGASTRAAQAILAYMQDHQIKRGSS